VSDEMSETLDGQVDLSQQNPIYILKYMVKRYKKKDSTYFKTKTAYNIKSEFLC